MSPPGTHNSLMGAKNQEVKLQEITAKATWRIRGGEDLNKVAKERCSESLPYLNPAAVVTLIRLFKLKNKKGPCT